MGLEEIQCVYKLLYILTGWTELLTQLYSSPWVVGGDGWREVRRALLCGGWKDEQSLPPMNRDCSLLCLYTEQMDSHHSVYLNVTAAPRIEQKNNYSRAELTSEAKQGDLTGFSRGDPRHDLLSCHGIKTSTGALLAADWSVMGKDLVGCLMTFMSSVCLLWVTASNLTSHILLIRASERRSLSSQASHQHPFPQILSHFWVTCTHTCTHRLTFSSCHWGCDTRGIGLWQGIHTVDRWVLLSVTGEKIEWMKKGGGGRMMEA